jgi:hypothetical protein
MPVEAILAYNDLKTRRYHNRGVSVKQWGNRIIAINHWEGFWRKIIE